MPFPVKGSLGPNNSASAVTDQAMLAKLEELLSQVGGDGAKPNPAESEDLNAEGGDKADACCPECGQPLPSPEGAIGPDEGADGAKPGNGPTPIAELLKRANPNG